jgi:LysM repeat protein
MSIKGFVVILVIILSATTVMAFDKSYQEQWVKRLDEVTQNFLLLHNVGTINRREKMDFPKLSDEEIDSFLKSKFGDVYAGFHPDVAHYVQIIANRPKHQLQLWYAIIRQTKKQIRFENANKVVALLIYSRLEFPNLSLDDAWLIPNVISLNYGNTQNEFVDQRLATAVNYMFRTAHYDDLIKRKNKPINALTMSVLGSATVTRIQNYERKSFWELYPDLKHSDRDFYAVFLASAVVLNELEKLDLDNRPFPNFIIEDKHKFTELKSEFALNIDYLSKHLEFDNVALKLMNRVYYKQLIPAHMPLMLPSAIQTKFIQDEENIALWSTYNTHKIKAPFCLVKYKIKASDNIELVATNFSSNQQEIININHLRSGEVTTGKTIFIKVQQVDSLFFSSFDTLSPLEISEQRKIRAETQVPVPNTPPTPSPRPNAQKVHVVKSGETLSHIARKYNVTVKQIKTWNNLKSDNIQIGQKIIIKK